MIDCVIKNWAQTLQIACSIGGNSGTDYRSEMFLYAKQTGGHPLSAHITQRTVALIRTEI